MALGKLVTCWVKPGDGATVRELCDFFNLDHCDYTAFGKRTNLQFDRSGRMGIDEYDRRRARMAIRGTTGVWPCEADPQREL